jgi:hypothetical protein
VNVFLKKLKTSLAEENEQEKDDLMNEISPKVRGITEIVYDLINKLVAQIPKF